MPTYPLIHRQTSPLPQTPSPFAATCVTFPLLRRGGSIPGRHSGSLLGRHAHTHAVIPSWSLPNTSVGTAEVERYLMARERGDSRAVALAELRGLGMHAGCGKQLERRLEVIVSRGKALWPQAADLQLGGLAWVRAACAPRPPATPLLSLNHFSLERRVNAICCSRSSILLFGRRPGGGTEATPCPGFRPPHSLSAIITAPRRQP